ncbi:hypothetical protein KY285_003894 [Solanum tuberosum]|nr:hypothetical protein KY289_001985 [Solanum tuberosum]KAH0768023.1 hypothetical protein KY285_003894 [Solanum tuberosum]
MENQRKRKKLGVVPSKRGSSSTQKSSNSSKEKKPPPLKSYDATKFVSWEAQQRFKVKSLKKAIVEKGVEQGSLMGNCQQVYQEIVRRKWEVLFEQPEEANMTVVMEFYANLPEHEYQVCMVRGKTVNFAQEAIENAYNFPEFGGTAEDEYRTTYMKEPYKWDMFIEVICTPGQPVHWLKENHKFHSKSLNIETKCWFHIITSRILPSTNTTEVHGFRAALIFCLMTKLRILPGLLIVEEMLDKATSPKYGYFFPSLITRLCRLSAVKFKKSDVTLMAGPKFRADRMTIGKAIRQPASTEEVGNDDSDDVEELSDHVVPPTQSTQDSMGRSWEERFHSLENQVDALHSSMADMHKKMNELTVNTGKSDRKIMAWLRALGRTCSMDPSTVSDTD